MKPNKLWGLVGKASAYVVMGLFALMTIYPIIWLCINSFKSTTEYLVDKVSLPKEWILSNYVGAWTLGTFDQLIWNSILYTVTAAAGSIILAVLAGFAFAKISNKATGPIYGSFVLGILLSITSIMVPLYLEVSQIDKILGDFFHTVGWMADPSDFHLFYNTRIGVILIYIGAGLPMAVYLCTEYVKSIPDSLIEAARIDGAGYFTIFWRIILPMAAPIATTVAVITVPNVWNEFALINIIVSDTGLKSLPLGILRFSGTMSTDYGKQLAALVIGLLPMLLFYFAFQKQITKGVAGGAVKG
jgi:raffinose/stachyose/melibiose transport system permease protein